MYDSSLVLSVLCPLSLEHLLINRMSLNWKFHSRRMISCRYNTDRGAKSMVETLTRRNFLKYTAWFAADVALTAGVRKILADNPVACRRLYQGDAGSF